MKAKAPTPTVRTPAEDLATYEVELRNLKAKKRETTREINERIKLVEGLIESLSDEILATTGAHTGSLFPSGDDD
jgi:hypothetical protein